MSIWLYEMFLIDNLEKSLVSPFMLLGLLYLLKIGKQAVASYLPVFVCTSDGEMPWAPLCSVVDCGADKKKLMETSRALARGSTTSWQCLTCADWPGLEGSLRSFSAVIRASCSGIPCRTETNRWAWAHRDHLFPPRRSHGCSVLEGGSVH